MLAVFYSRALIRKASTVLIDKRAQASLAIHKHPSLLRAANPLHTKSRLQPAP